MVASTISASNTRKIRNPVIAISPVHAASYDARRRHYSAAAARDHCMDGRGGAEVSVAPVRVLAAKPPDVKFAVTLAAVTLIGPLAIHFFLPVIPEIKTAFGISNALAEFTFSIALVAMGVATLVYGSLSDRLGRRPVLLSGWAVFVVGSVAAAVAGSIFLLIVGRLVQAVGAGCSVTLTRAMARDA